MYPHLAAGPGQSAFRSSPPARRAEPLVPQPAQAAGRTSRRPARRSGCPQNAWCGWLQRGGPGSKAEADLGGQREQIDLSFWFLIKFPCLKAAEENPEKYNPRAQQRLKCQRQAIS